ncbi:unnamed protein product [Mytilus coruscus]|uniref:Uncharacterized protein n=1 Tax=Mytilus coruscus TaxID=42192 RepID=A0A6J8B977_MYTCO|nr:unnamed protein product [Mytilus coruscus]
MFEILGPKQDICNLRKLPPVIRWSPIREQEFIENLNYDSFNNICTKTEKLIASEKADNSTSEVDDVVSDFNKLLKGATTQDNRFESKLHNKQKRRKIKKTWVDKDCDAKYRHIKALCKTLGRNPWDSSLRLKIFTERKNFNKLVRKNIGSIKIKY